MIIPFIIIAIFIISISMIKFKKWKYLGILLAIISVISMLQSAIFCIYTYTTSNALRLSMQVRYDALDYKIRNSLLVNPMALRNDRDLINDITEWNSDIVYSKSLQNNIWIGIYIPNIFDDLEIKLESYDIGG